MMNQGLSKFFLLCLSMVVVSANKNAYFGDTQIYVEDNGEFKCDQVFCPMEAERCEVWKHPSQDDPSITTRVNICYSSNNDVLINEVFNQKDAYPGGQLHAVAYRHGGISISSANGGHTYTSIGNTYDFDPAVLEQVRRNVEQVQRNVERHILHINDELEKHLSNLQKQLENIF